MLTVETDRGFQQTSIDSLPAVVIHNYTCHDTCTGILPNDVDAHRRRMHSPAPSNMTQRALSTLHLAKRADSSLFMHIPAEGEGDTRTCFIRQTAQGTENPRRHRPPHIQPAPPCMLPTLPSLGCMCNAGGSQVTAFNTLRSLLGDLVSGRRADRRLCWPPALESERSPAAQA